MTSQEFLERFGDISSLGDLKKTVATNVIDCGSWGRRHLARTDIAFDLKDEWIDRGSQIKILLAHFSPFKNELEGLDYPLFLHNILPSATIHLTFDKGNVCEIFELREGRVERLTTMLDSYDVIVGRSSVFNNMHARKDHADVLKKSGLKVQIKAMGIQSNHRHCDFVFDDRFLFTPPSPIFRDAVGKVKRDSGFKKHPFVLFLGQISAEKNQLSFLKMVDPDLMKGRVALLVGDRRREADYAKKIQETCDQRGIEVYQTGQIDFETVPCYTAVSSVHVINCDPRRFGQDYDPIPRCIGEATISDMHTACSKTTLTNDDMTKYVTSYDHEDAGLLNETFESVLKVDASTHGSDLITLEEKSYNMTSIILSKTR